MFKRYHHFTVFLSIVTTLLLCTTFIILSSPSWAQESFVVEYGGPRTQEPETPAYQAPQNSIHTQQQSSITQTTPTTSSRTRFFRPKGQQPAVLHTPNLQKAVKIGLLLPLTGEAAPIGQSLLNAAQQALFEIAPNYIQLLIQDTKGTPEGAQIAAQKILDNGAELILGPFFSHSVKAISEITRAHNVNVISFSTDWSAAGINIFIMGFIPFDQVRRVVSYASDQGIDFFAGLVPDSAYGKGVLSTFEGALYTLGKPPMKVATLGLNNSNATALIRDFSEYDERRNAAIQALPDDARAYFLGGNTAKKEKTTRAKNPNETEIETQPLLTLPATSYEAILLPLSGNTLKSITSLLTHYDVDLNQVKLLGTGIWDDPSLLSDRTLSNAWYAAPDPRTRSAFTQTYQTTFETAPHRLATLGYDAVALASVLAYRGIKKAGKPAYDKAAIMTPVGFAGLDGIFRFHQDGLVERGLAVLEIQRGTPVIIDPAPKRFN